MNDKKLIDTIKKLGNFSANKAYEKHKVETQHCISFGNLLKVSKQGKHCLNSFEIKHLNNCSYCKTRLDKLSWKTIGGISSSNLLACAGSPTQLTNIPGEILKSYGLPLETAIIWERTSRGYSIRIQANVPISLGMIFLKNGEELYRATISDEMPEDNQIVPVEAIEGWTDIRFLRKIT